MRIAVILAAAGSGSRFGEPATATGPTKVEENVGGRPVFAWSLTRLRDRPEVVCVVLAVDPARRAAFAQRWPEELDGVTLVDGGADRDETVRRALAAVPAGSGGATHVAVHDAARPAISEALLDRLFSAAAAGHPAVFPGVPIADTLRRIGVGSAGVSAAGETVSRDGLVAVQTPQVFEAELLRRAHAATLSAPVTDDAARVAALGAPVACVPGDPANRKLTVPTDLPLLAAAIRPGTAKSRSRGA